MVFVLFGYLALGVATKQGHDPFHWAINQLADHVASRAAAKCQLPEADIRLRADESALVLRVLERQVRLAVKLSPGKSSSVKRPAADPKVNNKEKLASQWAREAGHSSHAKGRCVSCGLLCVDLR